jgi:guanine deaminase
MDPAMSDAIFMELAIQTARQAIAGGQLPIGAVIVRDGEVLLTAHNTVWLDTDPTAHAEMVAVRRAAKKLGSIALTGCTVYVTLEPCPMCLAACHWARVERIVYGAAIADAVGAGFNELRIAAHEMVAKGKSTLKVEPFVPLRTACIALFQEWQAAGLSKAY